MRSHARSRAFRFADGARAALLAATFVGVAIGVSLLGANFVQEEVPEELPSAIPLVQSVETPSVAPIETGLQSSSPSAEPAGMKVPELGTPSEPPVASPDTAPIKSPDAKPVPAVHPAPVRKTAPAKARDPVRPPEGGIKRIPAVSTGRPKPPVEREPGPPPKRKGTLVFVIDDAGNNLGQLEPFLAFPARISIAVLPGLPNSAEAARRVRAAGKELLLHQPMESVGGQYPGPSSIDAGMTDAEIRTVLERNIAQIGPVAGINNHQGSLVTADEGAMQSVLAFCRDKGIFFLDSRTTADTVSGAVAAKNGIRIRERDVFVDNIQDRAAMIRFVEEGLQKAEKKGAAVMIGHAWSSELASTLRELYPELIEQGFSLSTIAKIMMGTVDDEDFGD